MHLKRRKFIETAASGVALLAAAGCDQLPRALQGLLPPQGASGGPFRPPAAGQIDPIVHVLNRAAFGARPVTTNASRSSTKASCTPPSLTRTAT